MRMKELLNGFSQQEVFDIYKFLYIYENKIKSLKNEADIYNHYPQLKGIEDYLDKFKIHYANDEAMQVLGIHIPKGFVYCTRTKSSKMYNLLYHLRNSIAHGQIEKENDCVNLIDYYFVKTKKNRKPEKRFSGRGKLDSSIIFDIIKLINNNIIL